MRLGNGVWWRLNRRGVNRDFATRHSRHRRPPARPVTPLALPGILVDSAIFIDRPASFIPMEPSPLSSSCGSFYRNRMSRRTLTHPSCTITPELSFFRHWSRAFTSAAGFMRCGNVARKMIPSSCTIRLHILVNVSFAKPARAAITRSTVRSTVTDGITAGRTLAIFKPTHRIRDAVDG